MNLKVFIEFKIDGSEGRGQFYDAEILAKQLKLYLSEIHDIGDIDDGDAWKDVGWKLGCIVDLVPCSIYLAKYDPSEPWQLTVELDKYPGLLTKLLNKRSFDYIPSLKILAKAVFDGILKQLEPNSISICLSNDVNNQVTDIANLKW
jgi:hypothetical protein